MIGTLSGPGGIDIDKVLDEVSARLSHRFTGVFSSETVRRYVVESYFDLARTARIHMHVPALAENFAVERLTAPAQTRGAIAKPVPEVLFLCAYNAGRSQIAASLGQRHSHGRVHVRCAGSHPADWLDLTVLEALGESGIEVEQLYPKPLTDDVLRAADVIVTMGCGDACPVLSGKRYIDWDIEDPAGRDLDTVRAIRNEIDARVRELLSELTPSGGN
jgi:arsenate reductase (thioredoxin)